MKKNLAGLVLLPLALVALPAVGFGQGATAGQRASAQGPYRKLAEIAIGGEGGWDYLSVDAVNRRLYVSHATKVVVVDVDTNKVVGEVAPTPGVHGIAVAPELGRGFVSNGRESTVSIFDLKSLQTVGKVSTGENPDAILYVPPQKEVWTFNGRGRSATVFDAQTGAVRATVTLPGKPEFAVFDEKTGRVYDNIEDTSQLVAIDAANHQVAATWPISPGREASGLALDPASHRLFVGCDNELMLMVDATTGKVLASAPIGKGVDANAFDPGTGLAFASSSDGTLTVARPGPAGTLKVVQALATPKRSRTMTLDPKTHRLYVAAAEFAPAPASADGRPQWPQVVAGSFKVVVYEMQ
ncbi:MAG TPA: YncE family protein, partial [Vicinamibacteria bacterium]|nr:YncE family protein [Vicinamibacteria bacterium]